MTSALKPKHPHGCDHCILLGAHVHESVWHDLYYCTRYHCIVTRHGPGSAFMGWDIDNTGRRSLVSPSTNVAIDMAIKRGLIHAIPERA